MQVLVLDDDPAYQARLTRALMGRGFQVVAVDNLAAAEALVRLDMLDLLILGERVQGRLSHSVALLAECRAPSVPSIFITDRQGDEITELFELIPAVYSIMGRTTAPSMVAQIAVAALAAMPARPPRPVEEEDSGPAPIVIAVPMPAAAAETGAATGQVAERTGSSGAGLTAPTTPGSANGVGPMARPEATGALASGPVSGPVAGVYGLVSAPVTHAAAPLSAHGSAQALAPALASDSAHGFAPAFASAPAPWRPAAPTPVAEPDSLTPAAARPASPVAILSARIEEERGQASRSALAAALAHLPPPASRRLHLG